MNRLNLQQFQSLVRRAKAGETNATRDLARRGFSARDAEQYAIDWQLRLWRDSAAEQQYAEWRVTDNRSAY